MTFSEQNYMQTHYKSHNPALNVHRGNEAVATNTIHSVVCDIEHNAQKAQLCSQPRRYWLAQRRQSHLTLPPPSCTLHKSFLGLLKIAAL